MDRDCYREILNELCADYLHFRLKNKPSNEEFYKQEKELWEYRDAAIFMEVDDIPKFEKIIKEARIQLINMRLSKMQYLRASPRMGYRSSV